jgi:hypothetical protein
MSERNDLGGKGGLYKVVTSGSNVSGEGTNASPLVVTGGGGGGYQGAWVAGTYAANSIVRRGPFSWGTVVSTSQDPCTIEGNLGNPADWQRRGNGSQLGTEFLLHNGLAQATVGYRLATMTGWDGRRLVVDAQVGPSGAADYFNFGILDAAVATTTLPSNGLVGITGVYGVNVDFGSNRVGAIQNGAAIDYQSYATVSPIGAGNSILETDAYHRYYLDIDQVSTNIRLTLRRDRFIWDNNNAFRPGYIYSWLMPVPSFTTWRFAIGSVQGGGSPGLVRVNNAWTQYIPGRGDWELISMFPHTPQIDASIF